MFRVDLIMGCLIAPVFGYVVGCAEFWELFWLCVLFGFAVG